MCYSGRGAQTMLDAVLRYDDLVRSRHNVEL